MTYQRGLSRAADQTIARNIRDAQIERAHLAKKLEGIRTETQALRRARAIIANAERQARLIREQAYDFGLAQLDRDYPTRQHRNRERARAKNTLVKHYAQARLQAATTEANQWEKRQAA